ncbi:MAG: hypothetical protein KGL39_07110 [Patescibacteria group bacterium]|nr:hypothetical protein [Patescibacteria group bacterium]
MTSVDGNLIAAGLRELANFFDETMTGPTPAALAQEAAQQPAKPRGRGRPPKAPETAPAAPAPAPAAVEADPFATPAPVAAAPAPTATLEEVRGALTALKAVTSQEIALGVLKSAGGADNLTSLAADKYGAVVAAAKAAIPVAAPEADPFAVPETAAPVKALTLEDVKHAVVQAQKRTGTDTVQKVVMEHGGKAADPETGTPKPSLKALPPEKFAAVIAAIQALPTTK